MDGARRYTRMCSHTRTRTHTHTHTRAHTHTNTQYDADWEERRGKALYENDFWDARALGPDKFKLYTRAVMEEDTFEVRRTRARAHARARARGTEGQAGS